ncbi:hypothetical protein V6N13_059120 [Hibiscus sabdariffa]
MRERRLVPRRVETIVPFSEGSACDGESLNNHSSNSDNIDAVGRKDLPIYLSRSSVSLVGKIASLAVVKPIKLAIIVVTLTITSVVCMVAPGLVFKIGSSPI